MKTVLISAIICTLCSLAPALKICVFGLDEQPATWDQMTIWFLCAVASTLVWLSITTWAVLRLRRKSGRSVSRKTRFAMSLLAAGYLVALFFLLMA
jgi:hypothetical protein